MIEAHKIGKSEDGQEARPKKLKKFNLGGMPVVVVTPYEDIEVIIGNDNQDGTTSVIAIYLDNNHCETSILEYGMIIKLRFGNQENNTKPNIQHIYDKNCEQCVNRDGHVIQIDDIALGEPNFDRLMLMPWDSFLKKVGDINTNGETISRFDEQR